MYIFTKTLGLLYTEEKNGKYFINGKAKSLNSNSVFEKKEEAIMSYFNKETKAYLQKKEELEKRLREIKKDYKKVINSLELDEIKKEYPELFIGI